MATVPLPAFFSELEAAGLAPFPVRRFTVEEYRRLGEIGVLTEDDRVELLEGWIVPKMNLNPPHSITVRLVDGAVRDRLPDVWHTRVQDAITTGESEPEPDVAIVRGDVRDYGRRQPSAADIGLLIEVADTSLTRDRFKRRLYARAGIPVYWIVNLVDRQIEVYTDPSGPDGNPGYLRRDDYPVDGEVPLVLDGEEIACISVRDLLP